MSDHITNSEYLDTPNYSCLSQVAGTLSAEPSQQPDLAKACTSINVDSGSTKKITLKRKTLSTLKSPSSQDRKTIDLQVRNNQTFIKAEPVQLIQQNLDIKPAPIVEASAAIETEVKLADVKDMDEPLDNSVYLDLPAEAVAECNSVLSIQASPSIIINERYIRMPEVLKIVSISRSSFYDRMNIDSPRYDKHLPRPIKKGRTSLWKLSEVMSWMNQEGV